MLIYTEFIPVVIANNLYLRNDKGKGSCLQNKCAHIVKRDISQRFTTYV